MKANSEPVSSVDLALRRKLWLSLSVLWLDTELDSQDEQAIALTLVESALSEAELDRIYRYELAPVLGPNLLSVAGVWSGFDPEWLCQTVLQHRDNNGWFRRWWIRRSLPQKSWTYATEAQWQRILALRQKLLTN